MSPLLARRAPLVIGGAVLCVLWLLRLSSWWCAERNFNPRDLHGLKAVAVDFLGAAERLELMTYDARLRFASRWSAPIATNLGLVLLNEDTLRDIQKADDFSWPLPRFYHARLLQELRSQGVRAVAFDIFFAETHRDYVETRQTLADGSRISADAYLARSIDQTPGVILSAMHPPDGNGLVFPAALFGTNASVIAHATYVRDLDSVVRRIRPFIDTRTPGGEQGRIWHMGIALAAREMNLDLGKAEVTPGRIRLVDSKGQTRVELPVDSHTNLLVAWRLSSDSPDLFWQNFNEVLQSRTNRAGGKPVDPVWRGRLAIVASQGTGNNLADLGQTPLLPVDMLSGLIWNVANSVITGHFVQKPGLPFELALLALFTAVPAFLSWRLRAWWATIAVCVLAAGYTALCVITTVRTGWMLPMVLPAAGALLMTHVALVTWRGINEIIHRSEGRSFWRRVLSKDIFWEWEKQLEERAGGLHRRVTVAFADLRGFTSIADQGHEYVTRLVRESQLSPEAAHALSRREAEESLATINRYLAEIARLFREHDGTFDKYIGDCVMAFWGAPLPKESHALACVQAAIAAQRRVEQLNAQRGNENVTRETENFTRARLAEPPRRMLPILSFGIGIHTGEVTVGTLGGGDIVSNYTVFGRDVNIASRLEGCALGGQILISDTTLKELFQDAPRLAARCRPLEQKALKGIRESVQIFEVPWCETDDLPGTVAKDPPLHAL